MHCASVRGNSAAVEVIMKNLKDNHIKYQILNIEDYDGNTAPHQAVSRDKTAAIKAMVENIENSQTNVKRPANVRSQMHVKIKKIQRNLDVSSLVVNVKNENGKTVLQTLLLNAEMQMLWNICLH